MLCSGDFIVIFEIKFDIFSVIQFFKTTLDACQTNIEAA